MIKMEFGDEAAAKAWFEALRKHCAHDKIQAEGSAGTAPTWDYEKPRKFFHIGQWRSRGYVEVGISDKNRNRIIAIPQIDALQVPKGSTAADIAAYLQGRFEELLGKLPDTPGRETNDVYQEY